MQAFISYSLCFDYSICLLPLNHITIYLHFLILFPSIILCSFFLVTNHGKYKANKVCPTQEIKPAEGRQKKSHKAVQYLIWIPKIFYRKQCTQAQKLNEWMPKEMEEAVQMYRDPVCRIFDFFFRSIVFCHFFILINQITISYFNFYCSYSLGNLPKDFLKLVTPCCRKD